VVRRDEAQVSEAEAARLVTAKATAREADRLAKEWAAAEVYRARAADRGGVVNAPAMFGLVQTPVTAASDEAAATIAAGTTATPASTKAAGAPASTKAAATPSSTKAAATSATVKAAVTTAAAKAAAPAANGDAIDRATAIGSTTRLPALYSIRSNTAQAPSTLETVPEVKAAPETAPEAKAVARTPALYSMRRDGAGPSSVAAKPSVAAQPPRSPEPATRVDSTSSAADDNHTKAARRSTWMERYLAATTAAAASGAAAATDRAQAAVAANASAAVTPDVPGVLRLGSRPFFLNPDAPPNDDDMTRVFMTVMATGARGATVDQLRLNPDIKFAECRYASKDHAAMIGMIVAMLHAQNKLRQLSDGRYMCTSS